MPPGMEWPRFEDGEKLKLGGQIPFGENLVACELTSVGFTTEGCFLEPDYLVDDDGDYLVKVNLGERVKRPEHDTKPEPPDSWEQLEEDAGENPFDYCKKVGHHLFTFDNAEEFKSGDLVRRAKALAEREAS